MNARIGALFFHNSNSEIKKSGSSSSRGTEIFFRFCGAFLIPLTHVPRAHRPPVGTMPPPKIRKLYTVQGYTLSTASQIAPSTAQPSTALAPLTQQPHRRFFPSGEETHVGLCPHIIDTRIQGCRVSASEVYMHVSRGTSPAPFPPVFLPSTFLSL